MLYLFFLFLFYTVLFQNKSSSLPFYREATADENKKYKNIVEELLLAYMITKEIHTPKFNKTNRICMCVDECKCKRLVIEICQTRKLKGGKSQKIHRIHLFSHFWFPFLVPLPSPKRTPFCTCAVPVCAFIHDSCARRKKKTKKEREKETACIKKEERKKKRREGQRVYRSDQNGILTKQTAESVIDSLL